MPQNHNNINHRSHTRKHTREGYNEVKDHAAQMGETQDRIRGDKPITNRGDKTQEDMGYSEQEVLLQHGNNKNLRLPQGGVTKIP